MKIPKLRFKEFTDSWEEKKILDFCSMKARIGWQNLRQEEHLDTGDYYLVTGTDFYLERVNWENTKFVSKERYLQDKNIILKEGDILITKDGSIGKLALVEDITDKKATLNNGIFRIRIENELLYPRYLFYTFSSERFKIFLNQLIAGSTIVHLYQRDFEKYKIAFPTFEEQEKIGNFLSSVDKKISLTEEKLNLFKEYKKGMMQKIFKQEIRFKDENGNNYPDWVEKTLGELCDISTGKKDTQDKVDNGQYPFFVRSQIIEKINSYSFDGEAILTAGDGVGVGKVFHYINGKFDFHQRVYKLSNFNNCFGRFIFEKFRKDFIKEVRKYNAKTSVDSVRMEMISNMKINLPCLEEQEKIAKFLSSIDNKIENLSNKLENLKLFKKGLLQKMFV